MHRPNAANWTTARRKTGLVTFHWWPSETANNLAPRASKQFMRRWRRVFTARETPALEHPSGSAGFFGSAQTIESFWLLIRTVFLARWSSGRT